MSELSIEFGKHLRSLRHSKKMSQEEIAFMAGISPAHLGQIERAQKKPTLETIGRLADALDVSVGELFMFDVEAEKSSYANETLEKINAQLSAMPEEEQKDILRIIRIFRHSCSRRNS